jgi:hypothetical protein
VTLIDPIDGHAQVILQGLFYVIDGFLDIFLPVEHQQETITPRGQAPTRRLKRDQQQKLLFTVKSGGIAGYLGKPIPMCFALSSN